MNMRIQPVAICPRADSMDVREQHFKVYA